MPRRIIDDLGLSLRLARRRYSSYTPVPGGDRGLLVDHQDAAATQASFKAVGAGAVTEVGSYRLLAKPAKSEKA